MAGELSPQRAPLNPLCCSGTAMQPQVLLMAKLALVVLLTEGVPLHAGEPFAPVFTSMVQAPFGEPSPLLMKGIFAAAGVSLLLNRMVRAAAAALGLVTLHTQLISAPAFSSHLVLCGLLLLLGALQPRGEQPWLARLLVSATLAVLAVLHLASASWLAGTTIESWVASGFAHPLLSWVRALAGERWISQALAWSLTVAELALALGLALPATRRVAGFGLAVYLLLVGFTLATRQMLAFSIVLGLSGLAYLLWPRRAISVLWPRGCGFPLWVRVALDRGDFDGRLDWPLPPDPDASLEVNLDQRHYHDARALSALLLHFPAFLILAFLVVWGAHLFFSPTLAPIIHVIATTPVLVLFASRRIQLVARRLEERIAARRS